MKKKSVIAFLTFLAITNPMNVNAKGLDSMSIMSCSKGDRLKITLNEDIVDWDSSDKKIATIDKNGIVVVKSEGECELKNKELDYIVKVKSKGEVKESGIIEVDYETDVNVIKDVEIQDKANTLKTVEVNEVVKSTNTKKTNGFEKVNEKEKEEQEIKNDTELKAKEEGNYILESSEGTEVVKVISPELNQTEFTGYVTQETELKITNMENLQPVFSSSNEEVATVDENGLVTLHTGGDSIISVKTENNELQCKIHSIAPTIDTSSVSLGDASEYQLSIIDNGANLPVSYEVTSGDGYVSENGVVFLNSGNYISVQVDIGGFSYRKLFTKSSAYAKYWNEMQPAIEECLGTPYLMGGETPKVALDCSAYASCVLRSVGLLNGRLTAQGLYDKATETTNPQPGDLVFFHSTYDTPSYVTHVGIYAGDNAMYHSGNPNQYESLGSSYWQSHLVGYGSFITETSDIVSGDINVDPYAAFEYICKEKEISDSERAIWEDIITKESGWNTTIWNSAGSGAYGLGQALPADKMAPYGEDYMTNPYTQLKWMYDYIIGRYGSFEGVDWHSRGWY